MTMHLRPLAHLVRQNLRRNLRLFLLSALGIVIGIAAFVFFLGLSGGVRRVVLGDIFPINRVEVIAPKTTLTGLQVALTDDLVAKIRARPEVAHAYPKMLLLFPAKGSGSLFGADLYFPMGGFCDGIDPELIAGEKGSDKFRDWEAEEAGKLAACAPERKCPKDYYCGPDEMCHHRVPVLISRHVVELYNGSFAPAHGLRRIGMAEEAMLDNLMKSLRFHIELGKSPVKGLIEVNSPSEKHEGMLVAISNKAMPIGITVPIGYVKRWNKQFIGDHAVKSYSSIVVDLAAKDQVASFVSWVKAEGYEQEESYAENFALVISIVTLLFLVISFVIIGMSAVNIAHTFFMLISDRKREIGIMRAVGASKADVRRIILAEAAAVGALAGTTGIVVGVAAAKAIDFMSARFVPDFPFKPTSYFLFTPGLILGALAFAVTFCLLGAFLPARRAANLQPAQALTS
jgi:ABC-type lipoprotein release transport system permease subunit